MHLLVSTPKCDHHSYLTPIVSLNSQVMLLKKQIFPHLLQWCLVLHGTANSHLHAASEAKQLSFGNQILFKEKQNGFRSWIQSTLSTVPCTTYIRLNECIIYFFLVALKNYPTKEKYEPENEDSMSLLTLLATIHIHDPHFRCLFLCVVSLRWISMKSQPPSQYNNMWSLKCKKSCLGNSTVVSLS